MSVVETILLQLDLGDVEQLTVAGTARHVRLTTDMDGCGSTTILDRAEAIRVRNALTRWIGGQP